MLLLSTRTYTSHHNHALGAGTLLDALGSANWKDRKQALDDIEGLLTSAGGRIQPQVCLIITDPALVYVLLNSSPNLLDSL